MALHITIHEKNGFVKRSKILSGYRKIILLNHRNNYVERSNQLLEYQKFFVELLIIFKIPTKLF